MNILIGIGGVSRSGKTALAEMLARELKAKKKLLVQIIHQDQCVIPESQLNLINGKADWEHPVSIDWPRLNLLIDKGLQSCNIVIVEGLFAFYDKAIVERMNIKIFLEISKPLFIERKREDLRWGLEPDWYIEHIWEAYLRYGRPSLSSEYACLNGARDIDIRELLCHCL